MIGSQLYGYKSKLRAMLDSFDAQVGLPNGLKANNRASTLERREMMNQAFASLQANSGLQDDVITALLKPHYADPESLLNSLHLPRALERPPVSQFIETMTRPVTKSCSPKRVYRQPVVGADRKPTDTHMKEVRDAARE